MLLGESLRRFRNIFRKTDVQEDLDNTRKTLTDIVIPVYTRISGKYAEWRLVSKESKILSDKYFDSIKERSRGSNLFSDNLSRLNGLLVNLDFIIQEVDKELQSTTMKSGMNVKKANLLQAGSIIGYITRFSLDFADCLLSYERNGEDRPTPSKIKRVTNHVETYASALAQFGMDPKTFKQLFDSLPDMIVNADTYEALAGAIGENKINPIGIGVKGFSGSIIYSVRLMFAEWQVNNYKADKDKAQLLSLKLLDLESEEKENPNPALEREIDVVRNRLTKLEYKVHKFEEDLE